MDGQGRERGVFGNQSFGSRFILRCIGSHSLCIDLTCTRRYKYIRYDGEI